jgi:hypothetical protein
MRSPMSKVGNMDSEGMNRGSATKERKASEMATATRTVLASSAVTFIHSGSSPFLFSSFSPSSSSSSPPPPLPELPPPPPPSGPTGGASTGAAGERTRLRSCRCGRCHALELPPLWKEAADKEGLGRGDLGEGLRRRAGHGVWEVAGMKWTDMAAATDGDEHEASHAAASAADPARNGRGDSSRIRLAGGRWERLGHEFLSYFDLF